MPVAVVFDVRCLQDVGFRDRGVGRLAANLVRSARTRLSAPHDFRIIGVVDPALPPLEQRFRKHFDEVRPGGQPREGVELSWFIQLSPMTHDPLLIARRLNDARTFKATVVHDFIPLLSPDQYLPTFAQKFDYNSKLKWLSRYDHFFPNSNYTKTEIMRVLGTPEKRITISPPPIETAFLSAGTRPPAPSPAHILVVGGADRRKNVDCAIGAHANSRIGRTGRAQLLVLGGYPASWQVRLRGLYADQGGIQSHLNFLDHVSDEDLVTLYRNAACVVAPSRAEGFSIPVAEGMAAGVPVFASAIPAHRELIENPRWLFDSEDYLRLAYLIDRVVGDPSFRADIIDDQANRWQRFQAHEVAQAFWGNLEKEAAAAAIAAPLVGGRRPQIAVLGPLPPDRSGVADYTAATFKELGKLADVYAFTPTRSAPRPEGAIAVAPISAIPHLTTRFDRVIGVMGNSHFHLDVYRLLMRYGGACIEHDNRLLGFYRNLLGEARTLELAQIELGRPVESGELNRWLADESSLEATFLGEVAARSEPLFVHSRGTARIVRERFEIEATYLPFSVYREWREHELAPRSRALARSRLGMARDEIAIVTLGYVGAAKAPFDCLWALDTLHGWGIPAKLYFVGEIATEWAPLARLRDELELTSHVRFISNYVSESEYRGYLLAADATVQLRTHLLGGLSGALLDCIAVGVPTVANQDLAEAMEAPSFVFRVPDRPSPVLIAEALANALASRPAGSSLHDERRAYCEVHSFRRYAEQLCAGLSLEIARQAAA